MPKAVLLLGTCGGLKHKSAVGDLVLPIAAIRGDGTSDDYLLPEVPAHLRFRAYAQRFASKRSQTA